MPFLPGSTPSVVLLAHLISGAILGRFYQLTG
jgi:hypothetical protein